MVSYHLKSSVGHVQEANGNNQEQDEPYINVLNLVTHIDNLEAEDLFQYVVTAALLTTYLERRTNFFDSCIACENDRYFEIILTTNPLFLLSSRTQMPN